MQVVTKGDVVLIMTDPQKRMGFAYNTVRGVRSELLMVDTMLKWGYWDLEDRSDEEVAKMEAAPQVDAQGKPAVERPMQEALILEHLPGQHDQASHNPHDGASLSSNTEVMGDLNASPFIAAIQKNGGFTFPATTTMDEWATDVVRVSAKNVTSGFAVARVGFAKSMDKAEFDGDPAAARAFIERWLDSDAVSTALSEPDTHVGGWYDADKGIVTLDVSEVHTDKDAALTRAVERGEKGIYDLETGETILTGMEGNE